MVIYCRFMIFTCVFFILTESHAFKFTPMSATLGVKEGENSTLFNIENDSDKMIAVQVHLKTRSMDISGKEINDKNVEDLTVYPTQLIVPAGEKRTIKVTWTGKNEPSVEKSYRVFAEQLPIELEKVKGQKASIKVLLQYVAALYVKNSEMKSDVKVSKISISGNDLEFFLDNSGKSHQVLTNLSLKFTNEKNGIETLLVADDLKGMNGENILAESLRKFSFPRQGKFLKISPEDKVKLSFDKN